MSDEMVCTRCGTTGYPVTLTKGSIFLEIVLWLMFLLPGILYSIWRLTTKRKGCAACGADELVPVESPTGRTIRGVGNSASSPTRKVIGGIVVRE